MNTIGVMEPGVGVLLRLADSYDVLWQLMPKLHSMKTVKDIRRGWSVKRYRSSDGPTVEGYIEAELADHVFVYWWLEVGRVNGQWALDAHIGKNTSEGMDYVKRFPAPPAQNIDQALDLLQEAAVALTSFDYRQVLSPTNDLT